MGQTAITQPMDTTAQPPSDYVLSPRLADCLLEAYLRLQVIRHPGTKEPLDYLVLEMNRRAERLMGYTKEQAVGKSICTLLSLRTDYLIEFDKRLERGHFEAFEHHFEHLHRHFLFSFAKVTDDVVIIFFRETTLRRKAQAALQSHEVLFNNAQDIILYVDMAGQLVDANRQACAAYGYTKEELLTMRIQDIRHPSTMVDFAKQMEEAELGGVVFESLHVRADGSTFPVEVSARSTDTADGTLRIHIIRDITERKEQESRIAWLARYDSLTGILNRASFLSELEREIARASRIKTQFALLMFDIDGFKQINDTYGHVAGDHVLKYVAQSVKSVLRSTDHMGRLGGDEFTVLQTGIERTEDILSLIGRMRAVLEKSFPYEQELLHVNVSLGVSTFPGDSLDASELLNLADQAMYKAKRSGGNGYNFFSLKRSYGS